MNKLRLFFILLAITLLSVFIYNNSISFNKLSKLKVILPEKKNLYNDIFLKDSNLVSTLTFTSNSNLAPIQSFIYKQKFDVLVFPIKELDPSEIQLPISSFVSFINDSEPQETTIDQIYDGSYKTRFVRFLSLVDSSIVKNKFKVYYEDKSTLPPTINNNMLSYSLHSNSLQITTEGLSKVLYYIDNLHSFTQPKISMEITFFKKDKFLYVILTFPHNNEIIKNRPEIINIIKQ